MSQKTFDFNAGLCYNKNSTAVLGLEIFCIILSRAEIIYKNAISGGQTYERRKHK